jgi:AcrR family transcriptional regulator
MDYVMEMGRRERKRQAVHQNLIEAGARLFQEQGVARTTVDDIVGAVDVARQTFFNHFPYKEALALELGAEWTKGMAQCAHALLEAGTPASDVLERVAEWALEAALQEGELAVVVAQELLHSDPERSARARGQVPLCEIFEAILIQAREEGGIRDDLPVDVVASRISAVVVGSMAQVLSASAETIRRELAVCFDIVFNGITDRSR